MVPDRGMVGVRMDKRKILNNKGEKVGVRMDKRDIEQLRGARYCISVGRL